MQLDEEMRNRTYAFVRSLRRDGGFSFSRLTPPTLIDTRRALETIELLAIEHDAGPERSFLERARANAFTSAARTAAFLCSARISGAPIDDDTVAAGLSVPSDDPLVRIAALIDAHRRAGSLLGARIEAMLARDDHLARMLSTMRSDGRVMRADGMRLGMAELDTLSAAARILGRGFDDKAATRCALAAKSSDGGFGFYAGTTSFLDNAPHALAVLERAGTLDSIDREELSAYLESCRGPDGGYARRGGALQNLESTWDAMRAHATLAR